MKIIWTHEALEQLVEIEDFISKDSPERSVKFVDEIVEHAEAVLPGGPRIGRTVPEISNPDIRELIFKKYRIVCQRRRENVINLAV